MIDPLSYQIRIARLSDSDAVSALLLISYSTFLTARYDADLLRHALPFITKAQLTLLATETYYVAETELGSLVGCGGWTAAHPKSGEIIEREAHIRHFATHPEWGRRGVGASLLARCFMDARQLGIGKLNCYSSLNAEEFYQASGFQTIGPIDIPAGPSLVFPTVLMSRELR
jgi:N-acetylglutamate synthase-like GNAT family acetyltransferase